MYRRDNYLYFYGQSYMHEELHFQKLLLLFVWEESISRNLNNIFI